MAVIAVTALVVVFTAFARKAVERIHVKRADGTEITVQAPKDIGDVVTRFMEEDYSTTVAVLNGKGFHAYSDPALAPKLAGLSAESELIKDLVGRCIDREVPFKPAPVIVTLKVMDSVPEVRACDRSALADKALSLYAPRTGKLVNVDRSVGHGMLCATVGGGGTDEPEVWIPPRIAQELGVTDRQPEKAMAVVLYSVRTPTVVASARGGREGLVR